MNEHGFSLLEITVTLCIIGILTAIAYPTYHTIHQQQLQKQAIVKCHQLANQLNAVFMRQQRYTEARIKLPISAHYHYRITTSNTSYLITATPNDHDNPSLTLDEQDHLTIKKAIIKKTRKQQTVSTHKSNKTLTSIPTLMNNDNLMRTSASYYKNE